MAIEVTKDPRTRKEITIVSGVVEGVFFNELKEVKSYAGKNGPWTPTHSVNLVVDGTRIGLGLTDKDKLRSKDVDGEYQDVVKGVEVSVEITQVGEYNGKPQYNSQSSKVLVLDTSGAQAPQQYTAKPQASQGGSSNTYAKKDDTPIVAGNARTAAAAWLSRFDGVDFKEMIVFFAGVSHKARLAVKESNPSMSDFEVGVAVGQGTVIAAQLCDGLEEVFDFIMEFVNDVVPYSVDAVKALNAPKQETPAKKTAAKKATSKKEATPAPVDDADIPDSAFDDDDSDLIPF